MIHHDSDPHLHNPYLQNIPEPLKSGRRWMGTRFVELPNGKLSKPPYRARIGQPVIKADKTNAKNRATFEEVSEALCSGVVDAIGVVITEEDPYTVLDFDNVINPETGQIEEEAANILDSFDTYWETSISGTGLHGICIADKPDNRCRAGNIEMYDGSSGARFVVITGNQISLRNEISRCQEPVDKLYNDLFGSASKRLENPYPATPLDLDLNELLKRARKSKTGAHFGKLFDRGDTSGYESASDADYALINSLIFWCAGDGYMVEELFKASALYRPPPEKHKNYVRISVRNALASYKGSYYRPLTLREKSTQEQRDILTPYLALLLDASRWKGQKAATAYKAYAAAILLAVEAGIATDAKELHIGTDLRRFAEAAGMSRQTLGNSSLPYLVQDVKLLRWERGRGNNPSRFVLPSPNLPAAFTIKESTPFNGKSYGDVLGELSKLIRMRSGVSRTGRIKSLGGIETVARLGMVAMLGMVTLLTSPQRGLNVDELVERMGRRKDHVRATMHKLVDAGIAEESRKDLFTLAAEFWLAYDRQLLKSGIVASERWQRKRHKKEREENEEKLKKGRDRARIQADPKVTELPTKRLRQIDQDTKLYGGPEEEREDLVCDYDRDYDRMCARVQERLARRAEGGAS